MAGLEGLQAKLRDMGTSHRRGRTPGASYGIMVYEKQHFMKILCCIFAHTVSVFILARLLLSRQS